jgi:hypothetical protein
MDRDHARDGAENEDGGDENPIANHDGAGFVAPETADQVAHASPFSLKRLSGLKSWEE